jgi:hypothetical protein
MSMTGLNKLPLYDNGQPKPMHTPVIMVKISPATNVLPQTTYLILNLNYMIPLQTIENGQQNTKQNQRFFLS